LISGTVDDLEDLNAACNLTVINQIVARHMSATFPEASGSYPLSNARLHCEQFAHGPRFFYPTQGSRWIILGNVSGDPGKLSIGLRREVCMGH
jgi:hypothetical protein